MTRQCSDCGTLLAEESRSPRCPRCWDDHQRARNRANVSALRKRRADQISFPTEEEIVWLDGVNPRLAEAVWDLGELIQSGRPSNDPELISSARTALERYDADREGFERQAAVQPDPKGYTQAWRDFFEFIRGALP